MPSFGSFPRELSNFYFFSEKDVAETLRASIQPRLLLAAGCGRVGEMFALIHVGANVHVPHKGAFFSKKSFSPLRLNCLKT